MKGTLVTTPQLGPLDVDMNNATDISEKHKIAQEKAIVSDPAARNSVGNVDTPSLAVDVYIGNMGYYVCEACNALACSQRRVHVQMKGTWRKMVFWKAVKWAPQPLLSLFCDTLLTPPLLTQNILINWLVFNIGIHRTSRRYCLEYISMVQTRFKSWPDLNTARYPLTVETQFIWNIVCWTYLCVAKCYHSFHICKYDSFEWSTLLSNDPFIPGESGAGMSWLPIACVTSVVAVSVLLGVIIMVWRYAKFNDVKRTSIAGNLAVCSFNSLSGITTQKP